MQKKAHSIDTRDDLVENIVIITRHGKFFAAYSILF